MDVSINWLGVILAALSSMIVGSIWYSKLLFGNLWAKLVGLDLAKMSQGAPVALISAFVMALLTAVTLAFAAAIAKSFFGGETLQAGFMTALWLWAGISASTVITHHAFEHRPLKLTLLTLGNQLVSLVIMGVLIGLIGGF